MYVYITSVPDKYNLIISNCLLNTNGAQFYLIVFYDLLNVEISGCEFYQNKGQSYLIHVYSLIPSYLELDDCRIYDNEVDYSTISIEGSNIESLIIVSSLITHLIGTFFSLLLIDYT